jgi:hypothetical protein
VLASRREGIDMARCPVKRLMCQFGLHGGSKGHPTIIDPAAGRPGGPVRRHFIGCVST